MGVPGQYGDPISMMRSSGGRTASGIASRTRGVLARLRHVVPFLVAVAAASAFAQTAASQASASIKGPDQLRQLAAAAKKEGTLTLYTSIAEKDLPVLIAPFEKKYGIKVRVWRASTVKVLQRTVSEAAARRYDVDVIHISSPEMEALHREQLLRSVDSYQFKNLIQGAVPAHREWAATVLSVWVQAYNTNLVRKEDLPKTYADLLDAKWKGKLGIEAEDQEWFSAIVHEMGEEQGLKYFRELVRRNGVSIREGHTLLTNMVVSGEVPLALTVYNYMPETAKRKGAPIDWTVIPPAVARSNAVGVARHAPHPDAALLFHEFMISDAQKLMSSIDYVPTDTAVPSPLKDLRVKLVDPARTLDQRDKWAKLFEAVFIKHSGT
jgi:iron(III) transport system substrate-binding protein